MLKLRNIYLKWEKKVCFLQNLCNVSLSAIYKGGFKVYNFYFLLQLVQKWKLNSFFHLGMRSKSPNVSEYSNQLINGHETLSLSYPRHLDL